MVQDITCFEKCGYFSTSIIGKKTKSLLHFKHCSDRSSASSNFMSPFISFKTSKQLFLVGAFSFKEKSPTITVASFFFFFFRQTTELIAYVPLFTETDKTTQAKSGQWKLSAKGPPFHFLPFLRNLQNRKRQKGPPFQFFFGTVRNFFSNFFKVSKESPLQVF